MIRKIIALLFIGLLVFSVHIHAQNQSHMIEIFHLEKGKVIKEIPITATIQFEAEKFLTNIAGIYKNINPLPKKGLIVRIPLDPPLQVQNQWIHTLVDEMNIIFPIGENPYIMIYDDENNTYFFTINSHLNSKNLSKDLGIHKLLSTDSENYNFLVYNKKRVSTYTKK
ncbi:hypothetical protein KHA94_18295 [Bacillus sp. FJAT-49705]|uniref:Uncharacterized protein n=1 Tax=Cytobacillus citreus TaxID=2833586 RepID=A0ABS5NXJ3_9BACI|nr:hypothetical protein [Cytobacillus citreus]MBS4192119.1 hypothetical protein [Cytobacillus citreus]